MKRKKIYVLIVELVVFILSGLLFFLLDNPNNNKTYLDLARIGTVLCVVYSILLCVIQKSIFNIVNLVFFSFWVFQYGLPVCYVIDDNYQNFYINLFENDILVNGEIYSILAIEVFAIVMSFMLIKGTNTESKVIFERKSWTTNDKFVFKVGSILFLITSLVEVPLVVYAAYMTKKVGFFAAGTRSFLVSNSLFKAVEAFCVPSGFLTLIYADSNKKKRVILLILVIIDVLQLIAGDRTNGLSGLMAVAYYIVFSKEKKEKKNIGHQMLFAVVLIVLLILLVYVAVARVSDDSVKVSDVLSSDIIMSFLAELGLNFTTICFVMSYIPVLNSFRFGGTYLAAFLCILPRSLDILGILDEVRASNPEMWLYSTNHNIYGSLLDFGVGFSLIGESYMNFSWFGLIAIGIIGILIMKFISHEFSKCGKWQQYMQIVLLICFMTFARRSFYDLLKDIEYSIFGVALVLFVAYQLSVKRKVLK